jgi:uncharacterized membrane protein
MGAPCRWRRSWEVKVFKWWQDLQDRDRAFNDAIARGKTEREEAINKLSEPERAEYEVEMQALEDKSSEQAFQTVLNAGRFIGITGIIGTMLFYPPGIFALLPFFVAIWGIQLLTKK